MNNHHRHDIPDPSDWTRSRLEGLKDIDETLRCHICKEFFTAPMITGCGHTFCSLCIQRYLTNTSQRCPTCMQEQQVSYLRKNVTVETLVEHFSKHREVILSVVKEVANEPIREPSTMSDVSEVDSGMADDGNRRSGRKRSRPNYSETPESDDVLVECPVCQGMIPAPSINKHLDNNCQTVSDSTNWLSNTKKKAKPLRKITRVNQATDSMANVKRKLQDEGLNTSGTKQALYRRYDEWVTLWNANVDNKNPRSKSEVKDDLRRWESTMTDIAAKTTLKGIDEKSWVQQHKEDYDYLIEQARASIKKKKEGQAKEVNESIAASDSIATNVDAVNGE